MDIRKIQYFAVVYETLNYTHASKQLFRKNTSRAWRRKITLKGIAMDINKKNQADMTDEMWDLLAKEYEDGTWSGVGEITPGRPKLYDEDMETVSFRLPRSRIAAIEAVTARRGESKSEFYRKAVDRQLLAEGM